MARFCQRCRQPCTDQEGACPRCGTNLLTAPGLDATPAPTGQLERSAVQPRRTQSDSVVDLDLGFGTAADDVTGPPSGASFVSWGALAPQPPVSEDDKQPAVLGAASSACILLNQAETVDLASTAGVAPTAPPSGASFVSWGTLASAQHVQRRTRWRLVLLALIGVALAAGLALRLLGLV